jgi:hypothetical protein
MGRCIHTQLMGAPLAQRQQLGLVGFAGMPPELLLDHLA